MISKSSQSASKLAQTFYHNTLKLTNIKAIYGFDQKDQFREYKHCQMLIEGGKIKKIA